ncbi:hypothetical protein D1223_02660 [Henriciella mobilis]|uniref:Uncharacterized protein n=1 Tax=Henriciella mobilis TaxID=2305467 RepID=A0A399RM65_9PROT|nr:hypothetical protein D1223_02660 [Henriciella mobilis]
MERDCRKDLSGMTLLRPGIMPAPYVVVEGRLHRMHDESSEPRDSGMSRHTARDFKHSLKSTLRSADG